jgi:hypothetical protein
VRSDEFFWLASKVSSWASSWNAAGLVIRPRWVVGISMPGCRIQAGVPENDLVVSREDAQEGHLVGEVTPQIIAYGTTALTPQAASPKQARDAQ